MDSVARPHNVAAWALKPKQRPLVVSLAPYKHAPRGHVVVKVHTVAINPIDWIMQDRDIFDIKYPAILGSDIAGTIEEVGEGVKDLRAGQRVIA
jgi:NADPH:quinone reductase-like Zn-dependent oxidoreductase